MNINSTIRIIAGFFIMLSVAMAHFSGQIDIHNAKWLWFTLFVGLNLFQSGFTKWCLMAKILSKLGVKD